MYGELHLTEMNLDDLRRGSDKLKEGIAALTQLYDSRIAEYAKANELLKGEVKDLKCAYENQRNNILQFLTEDQLVSLEVDRMRKWSDNTIIKCLKIPFKLGLDGYDYLVSTGYPMPCSRTIARRPQEYKVSPGILTNLLEPLKCKVQCMDPADRFCCLSIDEMKISPSEDFDKHSNQFVGRVSLGNTDELGTHLMIALLRGTRSRWKQVIAVEVTGETVSAEHMQEFVEKCIQYSENTCGLFVVTLTSDMGNNNVRLWSLLEVTAQRDGTVKNIVYFNGHPVWISPDVCHQLKNLKHALQRQQMHISEDRAKEENLPSTAVNGKYISVLWQAELIAEKPTRLLHHLKPEDLYPNNFEKIHVGSAVRYFSEKTAAAIEHGIVLKLLPKKASTTAWFIRHICRWFELVSSRVRKKCITKRNSAQKYELLHFIKNLFQELKIGDKGHWKPLNTGFVLSSTTIFDVAQFLLQNEHNDFFLCCRMTADALENVNSQVRRRSGATPNVSAALRAIKCITLSQFVSPIARTNYHQESDFYLLEYFDKKNSEEIKEVTPTLPSVVH